MKKIFDNILLQGWMFDPLEFMEKEEQDEYKLALIDSALTGEVQTDNPKWIRFIEKALSSIEETRAKYYAKAKKNGEKGKEYGIQGGEFGKLGGRPRKGETKEQYAERKKKEKAEWEKQQELYKMIAAEQGLFDFIKVVSQNQLQELASAYISKGFTKPQVSKVFEYIRGKKCG